MKFKFCSEGDCPLWALAALHALSSLPAQLFRTLLQHVTQEQPDDGIMEILKDTNLSSREECARAAAVIRWVLVQTWRCGCPGSALMKDLLVLGLGRAHASALAEAADAGREAYVTKVKNNPFMVNKVTDATACVGPEDSIDTIKLTLHTEDAFTGDQNSTDLLIDKSRVKVLLEELRKAYKKMDEIDKEINVDNY